MAAFASLVKTAWQADPDGLLGHATEVAQETLSRLQRDGIGDMEDLPLFQAHGVTRSSLKGLPVHAYKLLLKDSISPLPLHKTLVLLETLEDHKDIRFLRYERLALAKAIVFSISNLEFGPEVGVGPPKVDAPVIETWLQAIRAMAEDLRQLRNLPVTEAQVIQGDSRGIGQLLAPKSIDAVITSPPYPNEKDYTRTTRLESVLLGFVNSKEELREFKHNLLRSNTRNVYKGDRDDALVANHPEINRIADLIEARRIELGKTSGFERLYARVTRLYFGGMANHLAELRRVVRPGARLAYVVGDQASYLRVMIRTGQLLADIAQSLGYRVSAIDLFRTRLATATKDQLREEVVVLQWPGSKIDID